MNPSTALSTPKPSTLSTPTTLMNPICYARCYRNYDPALWTLTQDGIRMKICSACRSKKIVKIIQYKGRGGKYLEVKISDSSPWMEFLTKEFPMGRSSKQEKWNREALQGLTYVVTDCGPQRWWLQKVGRADDPMCGLCEEGIAQDAAHLLRCPRVADDKAQRWEQIWDDRSGARNSQRQ
ncbi:hypothetical protein EV426DRAFT_718548 [Tirmania nivea]|nr:hypothetical protein EV426DRAFT_718548 [Tirmania nivea]